MFIRTITLAGLLLSASAFAQTNVAPATTPVPVPVPQPVAATTTSPCDQDPPKCSDDRAAFEASLYLGEVVDTFAGDETIKYLNPNDANKSTLRTITGVDFGYRLFNTSDRSKELWVYGETVHGVRSKDVDCSQSNNIDLTICQQNLATYNPTANQVVAILRAASTLEAYVGMRYEFPPPLQKDTDSPARLYVAAQAGFLSVSGGGSDVVDNHQLAFGARAVGGHFVDSYLELGVGRNDLFKKNRTHRALIDGYLTFDANYLPLPGLRNRTIDVRIRPFIEFTGNFDLGPGSDSVQTWFGLDLHLAKP